MGGAEETQPSSDDKPFDAEPFDAGVEADEDSDPKRFIEQLTGKLGQALRKYNESQGQPDYELEKFAINSLLSASHTSQMDAEDQKDIIKKVKTGGEKTEVDSEIEDEPSEPSGEETDVNLDVEKDVETPEGEVSEIQIYENNNLFVEPKKNNMFQPGSNDILDEVKPCWSGYKQVGMKDKNGKQVPNCVPVNEEIGESNNYMFWQNLKTINHASGEILGMDQSKIDSMIENGHAWAVDHIATSSDDIEEVYHFLESNLEGINNKGNDNLSIPEKSSNFDKIKSKLKETFNQEEMKTSNSEPEVAPVVKPQTAPQTAPSPSRKNKPFLPQPSVNPNPKAINEGVWANMMKGVKNGQEGPWSIVVIRNGKVIEQDNTITIMDSIPAHYEHLNRKYPNTLIAIEDATGQIVWRNK